MYKSLIRPILFSINPETTHNLTFLVLKIAKKIPFARSITRLLFTNNNHNLSKEICGLKFKNPIGLAAGLDKNAEVFDMFNDFGFGFIEIGTVTPKAQPGNPKPRLFRLLKDSALINRMGFNNQGVDEVIKNIKKINKEKIILGANIGKNTATSNDNATEDYSICLKKLHPYVDYFTVNVSCPNVKNLADLQSKDSLLDMMKALQKINHSFEKPKPIFLKISPNNTQAQLDDILEVVEEAKVDGIVATNTTTSREGLVTDKDTIKRIANGGLSGKPLRDDSTKVIKYLRSKNSDIVIIGVGGIMKPEDAKEKMDAGANLVQLYSGYIYEGPSLIKNCIKALS